MNDLIGKWKNGEIEFLDELIKQIEKADHSRSLSDEYLKERGLKTREELGVAGEYPYGIVMAVSDCVLPYLQQLKVITEKNARLKTLLKECKKEIEALGCMTYPSIVLILADINAAIGESEEK